MKQRLFVICTDIALANNHKHPETDAYHHFSFIIQSNKIIEWGTNKKADALYYLGYPSYSKMHSEVDAYRKAKGLLDKSIPFEVLNIRLTQKTNKLRNSMPCKCCFNFLKNLGCKRVWYSTDFGVFSSIYCNFKRG